MHSLTEQHDHVLVVCKIKPEVRGEIARLRRLGNMLEISCWWSRMKVMHRDTGNQCTEYRVSRKVGMMWSFFQMPVTNCEVLLVVAEWALLWDSDHWPHTGQCCSSAMKWRHGQEWHRSLHWTQQSKQLSATIHTVLDLNTNDDDAEVPNCT